jgi:hypothetical protein
VNFNRSAFEALPLQKFPEMFLKHSNCPAEVGESDPLRRSAFSEFKKMLLDVTPRLDKQPLVLQDFLDVSPQFLDRGTLRRSVVRGDIPSFVTGSAASSLVMTFNQSNQC